MDYYKEYPIRCKTCNNTIASKIEKYEQFISIEMTPEEAFNELGIENTCCRSAISNPVNVFFNMENRKAILGLVDVNFVNEPDPIGKHKYAPVVTMCTSIEFGQDVETETHQINITKEFAPKKESKSKKYKNVKTEIFESPQKEQLYVAKEQQPFVEPTEIGIPTINPDPENPNIEIEVGASKIVQILSGRTYLAR